MQTTKMYLLSADNYVIEYWGKIDNEKWKTIFLQSAQQLMTLEPNQLVVIDVDVLATENTNFWQQQFAKHQCVVASLKQNDIEGQQVLALGAKGYVHAYSTISLWHQILTHIQNGHIWLGESLLNRLLSDIGHKLPIKEQWKEGLTNREIEVAQRIALGHPNQLIAQDLDITERTVRAHLGAVFTKLGINDRLWLALRVHGLVE